ncbi:hypothetical protein ACQB6R_13210 [Propionibacteriaceae bacterium G1746]
MHPRKTLSTRLRSLLRAWHHRQIERLERTRECHELNQHAVQYRLVRDTR